MAGRKRSEASRQAILDASLALVRKHGYSKLTANALASEAGVGKQTIYRWWSSLGEVVLEALTAYARTVEAPETGTLQGDLEAFLSATFRLVMGPNGTAVILKGLMAAAQLDQELAVKFALFNQGRRQVLRAVLLRHATRPQRADVDATVDMLFGSLWSRLLLGHAPIDLRFARTLSRLTAAAYQE